MDEPSSYGTNRSGQPEAGDTRALWTSFAQKRSSETRNLLAEEYMPLVRLLAEHLRADLPRSVEIDDLISSGTFGLLGAIESFDPTQRVKFETYASLRIRGAMLDELRSLDWAPRVLRMRSHRIADSVEELEAELGRPPTDAELSERVGIEERKLNTIRCQAINPGSVSLSAGCSPGDEGKEVRRIDIIEDVRTPDPFWSLHTKEIQQTVFETIEELPRQERLVVILYYFEQLTLKQVGKVLDLSESRVCQIHADIILRLQRRLLRWKEEFLAPQP